MPHDQRQGDAPQGERHATEASSPAAARPAGEIGGHTVQPWEQDAVPATASASKDVPPPGGATKELAGSEGTGAMASTGSAGATETAAPAQTRPPRPPVYKPQDGHEPAPRPTPGQAAEAKAKGPATDGDALVEAITKAIAENLAKALHQSIAQAVRGAMPLSGRSVAQPRVEVSGQLRQVAPRPKAAKPTAKAAGAAAANPAPAPAPSAPPPAAEPSPGAPAGDQPSQYGGTIEPPTGSEPADSGKP